MDPDDVARKVTPRTRAVCPVHYAGHAADTTALRAIAERAHAALLEDCAHAPLARVETGACCGTVGDVGAFSFFGNKNLTTGEGGMLTTMRDDVAARLRLLRSHGMTTGTWDRARGHAFSYDVVEVGTNARLDEVRAAIGLVQLGRLAEGNRARGAHVARYRERLAGVPGLGMPFASRDPARAAHHLFVVLLPEGSDRDAVMGAMKARGIQTSIHYPPTHRFSAYADARATLPVTERVATRLLTLPLWPTMTTAQVDLVADALREAL
jgi:dTDP-4-amino-4,6-dideoxygalactose transaminase